MQHDLARCQQQGRLAIRRLAEDLAGGELEGRALVDPCVLRDLGLRLGHRAAQHRARVVLVVPVGLAEALGHKLPGLAHDEQEQRERLSRHLDARGRGGEGDGEDEDGDDGADEHRADDASVAKSPI